MESSSETSLQSEVKLWIKTALSSENLNNFTIELTGTSEKGENYMGDVLFVTVTTDQKKVYDLVLKCSKRSAALRESTPAMNTVYKNEIYVYQKLFPEFKRFELVKGVEKPFDSVPRLYGTFIGDGVEVIVLENLAKSGFKLCERRNPLDYQHIVAVMREYGKFHAISRAYEDQKPDEFKQLIKELGNSLLDFKKTTDFIALFGPCIKEVASELRSELDAKTLEHWEKLVDKIEAVFDELIDDNHNRLNVVVHGDSWNNNLMFRYDEQSGAISKLSILDWQMAMYTSPISDLSYFLFTTISEDDIKHLDDILKEYHRSFSDYLQQLGSDPLRLYPYEQFIIEWRKFACYGLINSGLLLKICLTEKDEARGIDEMAESGQKLEDSFNYDIQNKDAFRKRIKHIVEYAVAEELI